jgi:hypothetical protein
MQDDIHAFAERWDGTRWTYLPPREGPALDERGRPREIVRVDRTPELFRYLREAASEVPPHDLSPEIDGEIHRLVGEVYGHGCLTLAALLERDWSQHPDVARFGEHVLHLLHGFGPPPSVRILYFFEVVHEWRTRT